MRLNILPIRELSGAEIPFEYDLELSDLELFGEHPIPGGVQVSGFAEHRADLLLLHMQLVYTVETACARCLKPLSLTQELMFDRVLVDHVENEEELDEEDILLLDHDTVDLDEVVREAVIFNAQMSYLCEEDCLGLCPQCGHNLNEGPCACKPEIDERLAALADLLKDKD